MQSCLYRATVMHNRLEPKKHRFHYGLFFFYLNLDTIEADLKRLPIVSRNRFNLFGFYDRDHLQTDLKKPIPLRDSINTWLNEQGISELPATIMLLTHEMKLYLLDQSHFDGKLFHKRQPKYFYVSPFIEHDAEFDFRLHPPGETLNIRIDDYKEGRRFFLSTLTGKRKPITTGRLLGFGLRFPFITLQIIGLIHWHAFRLWFKKLRFFRKAEYSELQRDVLRPYDKKSSE
jgi:DUF1365 family protein